MYCTLLRQHTRLGHAAVGTCFQLPNKFRDIGSEYSQTVIAQFKDVYDKLIHNNNSGISSSRDSSAALLCNINCPNVETDPFTWQSYLCNCVVKRKYSSNQIDATIPSVSVSVKHYSNERTSGAVHLTAQTQRQDVDELRLEESSTARFDNEKENGIQTTSFCLSPVTGDDRVRCPGSSSEKMHQRDNDAVLEHTSGQGSANHHSNGDPSSTLAGRSQLPSSASAIDESLASNSIFPSEESRGMDWSNDPPPVTERRTSPLAEGRGVPVGFPPASSSLSRGPPDLTGNAENMSISHLSTPSEALSASPSFAASSLQGGAKEKEEAERSRGDRGRSGEAVEDTGESLEHGDPSGSRDTRVPLTVLHCNIVAYAESVALAESDRAFREKVIKFLQKCAQLSFPKEKARIKIQPFGSYASGLSTRANDLDVVIMGLAKPNKSTGCYPVGQRGRVAALLDRIRQRLEEGCDGIRITGSTLIPRARIPILRFEAISTGDVSSPHVEVSERDPFEKRSRRQQPRSPPSPPPRSVFVDVCVSDSSGPTAALYMTYLADNLPPLRPLVVVLKSLLKGTGLNEVSSGGINSYSLTNLAVAHIQEEYKSGRPTEDLGLLLVSFLRRFGTQYDTCAHGVAIDKGGVIRRPDIPGSPYSARPSSAGGSHRDSWGDILRRRPKSTQGGVGRGMSPHGLHDGDYTDSELEDDDASGENEEEDEEDLWGVAARSKDGRLNAYRETLYVECPLSGRNISAGTYRASEVFNVFRTALKKLDKASLRPSPSPPPTAPLPQRSPSSVDDSAKATGQSVSDHGSCTHCTDIGRTAVLSEERNPQQRQPQPGPRPRASLDEGEAKYSPSKAGNGSAILERDFLSDVLGTGSLRRVLPTSEAQDLVQPTRRLEVLDEILSRRAQRDEDLATWELPSHDVKLSLGELRERKRKGEGLDARDDFDETSGKWGLSHRSKDKQGHNRNTRTRSEDKRDRDGKARKSNQEYDEWNHNNSRKEKKDGRHTR